MENLEILAAVMNQFSHLYIWVLHFAFEFQICCILCGCSLLISEEDFEEVFYYFNNSCFENTTMLVVVLVAYQTAFYSSCSE